MFSTSIKPFSFDSFFILRLVKREALSSAPTWSICGDNSKSGIIIFSFIAIIWLSSTSKVNYFFGAMTVENRPIYRIKYFIATHKNGFYGKSFFNTFQKINRYEKTEDTFRVRAI